MCKKETIFIYIGNTCNLQTLMSIGASLVTQIGKNPPTIRETWVQSLGWESLLEKGMATHSSILDN